MRLALAVFAAVPLATSNGSEAVAQNAPPAGEMSLSERTVGTIFQIERGHTAFVLSPTEDEAWRTLCESPEVHGVRVGTGTLVGGRTIATAVQCLVDTKSQGPRPQGLWGDSVFVLWAGHKPLAWARIVGAELDGGVGNAVGSWDGLSACVADLDRDLLAAARGAMGVSTLEAAQTDTLRRYLDELFIGLVIELTATLYPPVGLPMLLKQFSKALTLRDLSTLLSDPLLEGLTLVAPRPEPYEKLWGPQYRPVTAPAPLAWKWRITTLAKRFPISEAASRSASRWVGWENRLAQVRTPLPSCAVGAPILDDVTDSGTEKHPVLIGICIGERTTRMTPEPGFGFPAIPFGPAIALLGLLPVKLTPHGYAVMLDERTRSMIADRVSRVNVRELPLERRVLEGRLVDEYGTPRTGKFWVTARRTLLGGFGTTVPVTDGRYRVEIADMPIYHLTVHEERAGERELVGHVMVPSRLPGDEVEEIDLLF